MSYCRVCGTDVGEFQDYCKECGAETAANVARESLTFDATLLDGDVALREGECIEYVMRPGWTAYTFRLAFVVVAGLATGGVGLLILPLFIWIRNHARYAVTDQRLISVSGLVFGGTKTHDLTTASAVELNRKFGDDRFETASVKINVDGKTLTWRGVQEPEYVVETVKRLSRRA